MTIKTETIDLILSEKFDENFWLFELGRADNMESQQMDLEHQFLSSFWEKGEKLWLKHKEKLVDILCDKELRKPKELVEEMSAGSINDLVTNILTWLTTTYSLSMAISIPLCSLALKKGIATICK